jgi:hypothetical protein
MRSDFFSWAREADDDSDMSKTLKKKIIIVDAARNFIEFS